MNIVCTVPAPTDRLKFVKYIAYSCQIVFRRECCNPLLSSPDEFCAEFFIVSYSPDGFSDLRGIGRIKQDGRISKLLIGTRSSRRSHRTSGCECLERRKIVRPKEAGE